MHVNTLSLSLSLSGACVRVCVFSIPTSGFYF